MTGYGDARGQTGSLGYSFEVRSVNNRHLKLTLRTPEPYSLLEAEFEKVVRKSIRRGTILIQLRIDRGSRSDDFKINAIALQSYVTQLHAAVAGLEPHCRPPVELLLGQILSLPGVCPEASIGQADVGAEWPILEAGLSEALGKLQQMRIDEGRRMATELDQLRESIAGQLIEIRKLIPGVVTAYRDRLHERIKILLHDSSTELAESDILREVSVYADRSDVAEEILRLDSHLTQFAEILAGSDDSPGRKLEFVVQEMGRETNTLGSKAGDVAISRRVVEIKAVLEKIREIILNIE